MIKSVVRESHWSPEIIGDLFVDARDYLGLEYWYQDFKEMHDEIAKKK